MGVAHECGGQGSRFTGTFMISLSIRATGAHQPGTRVPSNELDKQLGLAPGSVFSRSGVHSRWYAHRDDSQAKVAAVAAAQALERAGLELADVDLLIGACGVQEQALPGTASAISAHLGLPAGTPVFDVNASCLSFLQALQVAASLLSTTGYRRILVVSADLASRGLDYREPEASLIFGDGAAAAVVERGAGDDTAGALLAFKLATYPQGRSYCEVRAGGTRCNPQVGMAPEDFLFRMKGKEVFRLASQHMPAFLAEVLSQAGLTLADIDWVVPHQASHLAMEHLRKRLGIRAEQLVDIYGTHGNQVAASLPTALHTLLSSGRARAGQHVLMLGTAAGLTLGAAVIRL